jgi:small subunit ribosomal protein S16
MVTVRLTRAGVKKRPFYHIIVTDSRNKRDGRYIERIGYYNPIATAEEVELELNRERLDYWVAHGAKCSDRVKKLIKQDKTAVAAKTAA